MIGEVRDEDTADLLIHAVQSGHQGYTTLHAPSAIGSIGRLRNMGVDSDILGSHDFISGLVYQTLPPVVCDNCSIPISDYSPSTPKEIEMFEKIKVRIATMTNNNYSTVKMKNTKGCKSCDGGIKGRMVVAEVIIPDIKMRGLFAERKDSLARQYWKSIGGLSVIDNGIEQMLKGKIDPFDLESKVGLIDTDKEYLKKGGFDNDNH